MIPIIIFVGAGAGGVLRYLVGGWIQASAGASFPWGTFTVNVTGSMLLAFCFPLVEQYLPAPEWRALVAVGFFGGYTTFSTFSYEAVKLMQDGAWLRAFTYVFASVALCLAGAAIGFRAADLLTRG